MLLLSCARVIAEILDLQQKNRNGDCEFVALAVRLGIRLVTIDKKLLRGFLGEAVSLDAAGVWSV